MMSATLPTTPSASSPFWKFFWIAGTLIALTTMTIAVLAAMILLQFVTPGPWFMVPSTLLAKGLLMVAPQWVGTTLTASVFYQVLFGAAVTLAGAAVGFALAGLISSAAKGLSLLPFFKQLNSSEENTKKTAANYLAELRALKFDEPGDYVAETNPYKTELDEFFKIAFKYQNAYFEEAKQNQSTPFEDNTAAKTVQTEIASTLGQQLIHVENKLGCLLYAVETIKNSSNYEPSQKTFIYKVSLQAIDKLNEVLEHDSTLARTLVALNAENYPVDKDTFANILIQQLTLINQSWNASQLDPSNSEHSEFDEALFEDVFQMLLSEPFQKRLETLYSPRLRGYSSIGWFTSYNINARRELQDFFQICLTCNDIESTYALRELLDPSERAENFAKTTNNDGSLVSYYASHVSYYKTDPLAAFWFIKYATHCQQKTNLSSHEKTLLPHQQLSCLQVAIHYTNANLENYVHKDREIIKNQRPSLTEILKEPIKDIAEKTDNPAYQQHRNELLDRRGIALLTLLAKNDATYVNSIIQTIASKQPQSIAYMATLNETAYDCYQYLDNAMKIRLASTWVNGFLAGDPSAVHQDISQPSVQISNTEDFVERVKALKGRHGNYDGNEAKQAIAWLVIQDINFATEFYKNNIEKQAIKDLKKHLEFSSDELKVLAKERGDEFSKKYYPSDKDSSTLTKRFSTVFTQGVKSAVNAASAYIPSSANSITSSTSNALVSTVSDSKKINPFKSIIIENEIILPNSLDAFERLSPLKKVEALYIAQERARNNVLNSQEEATKFFEAITSGDLVNLSNHLSTMLQDPKNQEAAANLFSRFDFSPEHSHGLFNATQRFEIATAQAKADINFISARTLASILKTYSSDQPIAETQTDSSVPTTAYDNAKAWFLDQLKKRVRAGGFTPIAVGVALQCKEDEAFIKEYFQCLENAGRPFKEAIAYPQDTAADYAQYRHNATIFFKHCNAHLLRHLGANPFEIAAQWDTSSPAEKTLQGIKTVTKILFQTTAKTTTTIINYIWSGNEPVAPTEFSDTDKTTVPSTTPSIIVLLQAYGDKLEGIAAQDREVALSLAESDHEKLRQRQRRVFLDSHKAIQTQLGADLIRLAVMHDRSMIKAAKGTEVPTSDLLVQQNSPKLLQQAVTVNEQGNPAVNPEAISLIQQLCVADKTKEWSKDKAHFVEIGHNQIALKPFIDHVFKSMTDNNAKLRKRAIAFIKAADLEILLPITLQLAHTQGIVAEARVDLAEGAHTAGIKKHFATHYLPTLLKKSLNKPTEAAYLLSHCSSTVKDTLLKDDWSDKVMNFETNYALDNNTPFPKLNAQILKNALVKTNILYNAFIGIRSNPTLWMSRSTKIEANSTKRVLMLTISYYLSYRLSQKKYDSVIKQLLKPDIQWLLPWNFQLNCLKTILEKLDDTFNDENNPVVRRYYQLLAKQNSYASNENVLPADEEPTVTFPATHHLETVSTSNETPPQLPPREPASGLKQNGTPPPLPPREPAPGLKQNGTPPPLPSREPIPEPEQNGTPPLLSSLCEHQPQQNGGPPPSPPLPPITPLSSAKISGGSASKASSTSLLDQLNQARQSDLKSTGINLDKIKAKAASPKNGFLDQIERGIKLAKASERPLPPKTNVKPPQAIVKPLVIGIDDKAITNLVDDVRLLDDKYFTNPGSKRPKQRNNLIASLKTRVNRLVYEETDLNGEEAHKLHDILRLKLIELIRTWLKQDLNINTSDPNTLTSTTYPSSKLIEAHVQILTAEIKTFCLEDGFKTQKERHAFISDPSKYEEMIEKQQAEAIKQESIADIGHTLAAKMNARRSAMNESSVSDSEDEEANDSDWDSEDEEANDSDWGALNLDY